jgi:hypothetical protein
MSNKQSRTDEVGFTGKSSFGQNSIGSGGIHDQVEDVFLALRDFQRKADRQNKNDDFHDGMMEAIFSFEELVKKNVKGYKGRGFPR